MAEDNSTRLLVIVTSDPRTSGRLAEAIRIAAGVGVWKQARIDVYLHGPAVLALSETPDDLIDSDSFTRYLPILAESGRPIYVERGASWLAQIAESVLPYQEVTKQELAEVAATNKYVMQF
jgi:hypothetical protein